MLNLKDKLKFIMYQKKEEEKKATPIYLEYLESDGNQYIDTKFKPNIKTTKVNIRFIVPNLDKLATLGFIGSKDSSGFTPQNFDIPIIKARFRFDVTGAESIYRTVLTDSPYVISFENNGYSINGIWQYPGTSKEDKYLENSMYLFNANNNGNLFSEGMPQKIYSCQIYDNGTLARNFRPCLNPDTLQPAMYDTVTKEYYYNQGTGEFKYELSFTTLDYIDMKQGNTSENGFNPNITWNNINNIKLTMSNLTTATGNFMVAATLAGSVFGPPFIAHNAGFAWIGNEITNIRELNAVTREQMAGNKPVTLDLTFNTPTKAEKIHIGSWLDSAWSRDFYIYSCQALLDNFIMLDTIPVRKNDGTICMYDFIKNEYLAFTYPNFIKGYKNGYQVGNNIQGMAGPYIDTKFKPNFLKSKFHVDLAVKHYNGTRPLIGAREGFDTKKTYNMYALITKDSPNYKLRLDILTLSTESSILDFDTNVTIEGSKSALKINNVEYKNPEPSNVIDETSLYSLYLFSFNEKDNAKAGGAIQTVSTFYASTEDIVNIYLIPVKKGPFIGMLDVLTGEEYPNMGSGEFIFNE